MNSDQLPTAPQHRHSGPPLHLAQLHRLDVFVCSQAVLTDCLPLLLFFLHTGRNWTACPCCCITHLLDLCLDLVIVLGRLQYRQRRFVRRLLSMTAGAACPCRLLKSSCHHCKDSSLALPAHNLPQSLLVHSIHHWGLIVAP
jgi:hypothetical protein